MFTILVFIFVLAVLVLFHEYGHFITARKSGVKVEEFGIGFPPRIFAWYKKNKKWKFVFGNKEITDAESTIYSINIIPLGGFNKIKGENIDVDWISLKYDIKKIDKKIANKVKLDNKEEKKYLKLLNTYAIQIEIVEKEFDLKHYQSLNLNKKIEYLENFLQNKIEEDKDAFYMQKAWKRILILFAGPFMNFVLAVLLLSIGFMIGLPEMIDSNSTNHVSDARIQIAEVLENSPAKKAGLELGDFILSVDGKNIDSIDEISNYMKNHIDKEVHLKIEREQKEKNIVVVPSVVKYDNSEYRGIGISLFKVAVVDYPWYEAIWKALQYAFATVITMIIALFNIVKNLVLSGHAGVQLAGPVGIARLTGKFAGMGFNYLLQFMAMFSINLGVINLLPIPALDGGRIAFILYELLRGKPLSQKAEAIAHTAGFLILILLVLVVSVKEVVNLF